MSSPPLPLIGGYPISLDDAEAWALRHLPDIQVKDKKRLPHIINRRRKDVRCILAVVDRDLTCFFTVTCMSDRQSTPLNFLQLPESKNVRVYKDQLFSHAGDQELAQRTQWTTIINPLDERHLLFTERDLPPVPPQPEDDETDETDETVLGIASA